MTALHEATTEAFTRLYREQCALMVRLARITMGANATAGTHATAEDVVQEAFAEVHRSCARVQHPVAYLRRAVISRSLSALRRWRVERRYLARHAEIEVVGPLGPEATAVRVALARLRLATVALLVRRAHRRRSPSVRVPTRRDGHPEPPPHLS